MCYQSTAAGSGVAQTHNRAKEDHDVTGSGTAVTARVVQSNDASAYLLRHEPEGVIQKGRGSMRQHEYTR